MRKVFLAIVICVLFIGTSKLSFAQGQEVTLDPIQVTANLLPLMVHLEAKVSDNRSISFGGGYAFSAYAENVNGESNFETYSTPFLTASFRNYYKRKRVNKDNLRNNSGNYVGLYSYYQFDTPLEINDLFTVETDLNSFAVGPVWGFQRNYASGIHLDLSVGLGVQGGESRDGLEIETRATIIGGFELGFRF